MQLSRVVVVGSLIAVAAFAYAEALSSSIYLLALLPTGQYEIEPVSRLLVMHLKHTGAVAAASLPFAIAIRALRPERPVLVALVVAILAAAIPFVVVLLAYPSASAPSWLSGTIDLLTLVCTLPAVTWLAYRIVPPNNSFKGMPLRGTP